MATIQVRVDDATKARADALFSSLGMDTSTAVRVFLTRSLAYGGFPFELRADPWRSYIEKALDEADEEAKAPGMRMSHEAFLQEMRAYIDELAHQNDPSV